MLCVVQLLEDVCCASNVFYESDGNCVLSNSWRLWFFCSLTSIVCLVEVVCSAADSGSVFSDLSLHTLMPLLKAGQKHVLHRRVALWSLLEVL